MKEDKKFGFLRHDDSSEKLGDKERDKAYRFLLKRRDAHNSSTSSLGNVSSTGSNSSLKDSLNGHSSNSSEKKHSHLSLKRFLKKFKHEEKEKSGIEKERERERNEKEEKKRISHHFLPPHSSELYKKYSKGKLLGTGASGSVNLVNLKTDPTKIFAVKKFRPKLTNESESDYKIKVNNEFKIGEILTHDNLIHTVELIKESNGVFGSIDYYIIMEYCKYDFFNLVMSGLMKLQEIDCYFKQIVCGVEYLHSIGLAHRDLKLDNCVVNEHGILKLIDFGSAVQFRKSSTTEILKPEETIMVGPMKYKLLMSKGIVGSDPYLAPEVFEESYDARKVDVWSTAIIFCCMILIRFPWKLPKNSDSSFKAFNNDSEKLLKLLPEGSKNLIKGMLSDKSTRLLMGDVLNSDYVENIKQCKSGEIIHKHNLVTEEQLEQINNEKEVLKKLKNSGIA